jgi:hypothetical protein
MKLPPPTIKRDPAFVGGLIHSSASKTSATTEGGSKTGHSYKSLPTQFRHHGFDYGQIYRGGEAAIYKQRWSGSGSCSACYEVIRIRQRDGFEINGRFVEAAEIYPNSEAWGVDGFTFTNRNKAWAKFFQMSLGQPARTGKEVK